MLTAVAYLIIPITTRVFVLFTMTLIAMYVCDWKLTAAIDTPPPHIDIIHIQISYLTDFIRCPDDFSITWKIWLRLSLFRHDDALILPRWSAFTPHLLFYWLYAHLTELSPPDCYSWSCVWLYTLTCLNVPLFSLYLLFYSLLFNIYILFLHLMSLKLPFFHCIHLLNYFYLPWYYTSYL